MKKNLLAGILSLACMASFSAHADWDAKVEDDIFSGGKQAMLVGMISMNNGIIFDCTKDSLSMAYVEKGDYKAAESLPVTMIVKVDSNDPVSLQGNFSKRNDEYLQAATTQDGLVNILTQLKQAQSKVLIGLNVEAVNKKMSFSADAVGSTKAVTDFATACGIKV
ncbi:hypothetical protein ABU178_08425 [Pantoea osteomyelitidis]|uniref:Uncharacterized protein n=1 Tax=Pantoea osteomyelitidis TaxID=3230026 RepID=A0ABW7PVK8_9GAMM